MINKKEILWVTGDHFLEVDIPIVKKISKSFKVHWIVFFKRNSVSTFTQEFIDSEIKDFDISLKCVYILYKSSSIKTFRLYFQTLQSYDFSIFNKVYINYGGIPFFYPILYFFSFNISSVLAIHDVEFHQNFKNLKSHFWYRRLALSIFNEFHVYSKNQLKLFLLKYPKKVVHYAPLYLQNYGFIGQGESITPDPNCLTFLFFGKIRFNKGLSYLLEAGDLLSKSCLGKFKIIIAGSCDDWDIEYKHKVKNSKCFEFIIRKIKNEEIPMLFAKSDYLVLPYTDVTQSGPLQIALNYTLPIIASDLPGFSFVEENGLGLLFRERDSMDLYHKMKEVIFERSLQKIYRENIQTYKKSELEIESIVMLYEKFLN